MSRFQWLRLLFNTLSIEDQGLWVSATLLGLAALLFAASEILVALP